MQKIAILFNVSLLGMIGYLVYEKGMPNGDELPLFVLMMITPIVSIIALALSDKASGNSLFTLYFKRKKLEESQRISILEKNL